MTAKEILALKCSNLIGSTPEVQTLALKETERFILNYCHISTIPSEACFLWANMALDLIKGSYLPTQSDALDAIKPDEVTSISAGDMSLSRDSNLIAHKVDLDSLLLNYREQLNEFRRMDWGYSGRRCWGR